MKPKKSLNQLKACVICHGKSEYQIIKSLKSTFRSKIEIVAKNNGEHSIQINSLLQLLGNEIFKSEKSFIRKYKNDIPKNKLDNEFKIFIIMDTDDCSSEEKGRYINKEMFKNHWAYNYITPIFNTDNLEDVLKKANIIPKDFNKKDYSTIFPINNNKNIPDYKQIEEMKNKLSRQENTNMDILLDFFLSLIK